MTAKAGIDLMRGRPTPVIGTTEAKLQQRKLDSLRRGIHEIKNAENLPYGVHLVGVGGAGAKVIRQFLRDAPPTLLDVIGSRLSVLAIDIGDQDLHEIQALASKLPADRIHIETVALAIPGIEELQESLLHYREFLQLEYPMYYRNPDYQPWVPSNLVLPRQGEQVPRALAKAIYGQSYYDGERPLAAALRRFAGSVESTRGDSVVCIVFGLGGGTGSGIAVDLARHLSIGLFGRRALVAGMGIAPCSGDTQRHAGAHLFPVLNELDCICDQEKNRGVTMAYGDLYKNPFTAGFFMVPQEHVWQGTRNLEATHARVNQELASLLTLRSGANLWETLRLLNWVAAPATQHSAARTSYGDSWIHMIGFADTAAGPLAVNADLPSALGLRPGYRPEFIEVRVADAADPNSARLAHDLETLFAPEVAPRITAGGSNGSVQFILPCIRKTDLGLFFTAQQEYDAADPDKKLLDHSWLLEQGVLLCEPSTRLEGMAGAGLWGPSSWIAVPFAGVRGPAEADRVERLPVQAVTDTEDAGATT